MRVVVQRVKSASVSSEGKETQSIEIGLLVFVGFEEVDEKEDIDWLSNKIANLRIFADEENRMNSSVKDVGGELLIVSQFTLHAKTKKGFRPSFVRAANPEKAESLYNEFVKVVSVKYAVPVKTGWFAADMDVELVNDGPVTINIDTKNKE